MREGRRGGRERRGGEEERRERGKEGRGGGEEERRERGGEGRKEGAKLSSGEHAYSGSDVRYDTIHSDNDVNDKELYTP